MARGVVSVLREDGSLFVRPLDEVGALETAGPADASLGAGASAVVSRESGTVWATTASGRAAPDRARRPGR